MIWLWILIGFLLIVLGLFIFTQGGQNLGPAISTIGVAIWLILLVSAGHAHDHNRPGLDGWYMTLKSGKGPCCGGPSVDATTLDGPDWEAKDGRYRVRIKGHWHDVPPDAVLTEPNLDGRTLVWPIEGWGGMTIRCFMPGTMG